MNNASYIGRITKDLNLRDAKGKAVLKFTLAVPRPFSRDNADFITVVAWEKKAELINKHCKKGSRIGVTGYTKTGSYDNSDGVRIPTFELICNTVEFLEPKQTTTQSNTNQQGDSRVRNIDISDDDLPF